MGVSCLLLILWTLSGGIYSQSEEPYCVNQIGSIPVEVGGNVTIPCSFTYPKSYSNRTKICIHWREGEKSCRFSVDIYRHSENWTSDKYTGRISMVGNPEEENTASIRIHGVKRTDGPVLCCVVEVSSDDESCEEKKVSLVEHTGTTLRFPDKVWIDQVDVVPAVTGEKVAIPCSLHYPSGTREQSTFVTWRKGESNVCAENDMIHTWNEGDRSKQSNKFSLVKFPEDISLIVKDVMPSDKGYYCCEVEVTRRTTYTSGHGTELVVKGTQPHSGYNVVQSQDTSVPLGGSATINCSFNTPKESTPLWTGIYWRVGSLKGHYSYHPSQAVIHSSYRHRTNLSCQTNLHIWDVQSGDSGRYYCVVVLRFCAGSNKFKSIVIHGKGTRLNVTETGIGDNNNAGIVTPQPDPSKQTMSIAIISSLSALAGIFILCGILVLLKKKGVICKRVKSMDEKSQEKHDIPPSVQASSVNANSTYETIPERGTEQVDPEGVLYAQLNMDSLDKGSTMKKRESPPQDEAQVLYSSIKPSQ